MTVPTIDELAGLVRQGLAEDERVARDACGSTVIGHPGNWRQAPGGDEWAAGQIEDVVSLLVALRPGLQLSDPATRGYWGAVAEWENNGQEKGVRGPLEKFMHAARHDPVRVLADVAAKRALLDEALGWKHHVCADQYYTCLAATMEHDGGVYGDGDVTGSCDCGRDERVRTVLQHLAQPYQEVSRG